MDYKLEYEKLLLEKEDFENREKERLRLKLALEVGSISTWEWDLKTDIVYVDEGLSRLFNLPVEIAHKGAKLSEFINAIYEEDREHVSERIKYALESGNPYFSEYRVQNNSGLRWVAARGQVVKDIDGTAICFSGALTDITVRKKSELALAESERKLKSLTESTNLIPWEVDASTKEFTYMSPAIERLSGYLTDEWKNFNFWASCIHPEDRNNIVSYCEAQTQNGVDHEIEYRIVTKQGEIKWIKDYVFVVKENSRILLRGFFYDSTLEKQTLNELVESEKRYRQLFENMISGYALHELIYDKSGKAIDYRFLSINPAFEKLTGLKAKTILGKTVKEALPGAEDYWINIYAEVVKTGKPISYENYSQDLKKHFYVFAFRTAENYFATVFHDITKRKKAEEALKESKFRFKNLSDLTFEGIVILKKGKALDINNSFTRITGYEKDELLGKNLINLLVLEKYKKMVNENMQNDIVNPYEFEIKRKDGEHLFVKATSKNISKDGLRVASIRDISERKEFRRKLFNTMIQAEERERERYAKELHDGLGPILSTCKVYLHTLDVIKGEEKRKEHINRANELLEDALRSIKEISNNLSPHILRNYGISQALQSFVDKLNYVSHTEFNIHSNFNKRLSEITEFTLYRTLVELTNNSIKYSNASIVTIEIQLKNTDLQIHFSDNGKGFDYETIKKQEKGFGLLNLEQRIKQINGNYQYNSVPGKGVQVEILLNNIC